MREKLNFGSKCKLCCCFSPPPSHLSALVILPNCKPKEKFVYSFDLAHLSCSSNSKRREHEESSILSSSSGSPKEVWKDIILRNLLVNNLFLIWAKVRFLIKQKANQALNQLFLFLEKFHFWPKRQ